MNPSNHHIGLNSICKKQKANNLQLLYPTIFGHPLFKPVFFYCPQALLLEVSGVVNNSWGEACANPFTQIVGDQQFMGPFMG